MDDQNWLEKVGLLKEIADIKGNQIRMGEQLANLIESKKEHQDLVLKLLNEHNAELYGPPEPGLKIQVDRLSQWKTGIIASWSLLIPIAFKVIYDWVKH